MLPRLLLCGRNFGLPDPAGCPLLAHSRHALVQCTCPLSGVKRTFAFAPQMSAYDPKRTFETPTAMSGFCYDFIWTMTANARNTMTTHRYCGMINRLWNTFAAAALIAVTLTGADAW